MLNQLAKELSVGSDGIVRMDVEHKRNIDPDGHQQNNMNADDSLGVAGLQDACGAVELPVRCDINTHTYAHDQHHT